MLWRREAQYGPVGLGSMLTICETSRGPWYRAVPLRPRSRRTNFRTGPTTTVTWFSSLAAYDPFHPPQSRPPTPDNPRRGARERRTAP